MKWHGMRLEGLRGLEPVLLGILLMASPVVVTALEFEPVVGAGMQYTSNARLVDQNEDSDVILVGLVGAEIRENDGPLRAEASTSLTYENYLDDTYGDKYWFNLNAIAGWEMIRERLDWEARNIFTQTQVNNLDADTPDNTQNTNAFSFGPNIFLPISERQRVYLRPEFRDFYYEDSDTDNQQFGARAEWLYSLYPTMNVGFDGGARKVQYDKDERYPDFYVYDLRAVIDGTRARSVYRMEFGGTNIQRDEVSNQNGFAGNISWLYNITGHSGIRAYASTDLTDSSSNFLDSEINPDTGDFNNVQTSGDVIRNNVFRVSYLREDSTLNSRIWGELRDLDYKETDDDREVWEIGAELDYQVTALLSTGFYGRYNKTKETDTNRDDDRYAAGVSAGFKLTRKLRTRLDFLYRKKDSNQDIDEYTEYSAFFGLIYGLGEVPVPGRYGYGSY